MWLLARRVALSKSAYTTYDFIDEEVLGSQCSMTAMLTEHVYDSALAERLVTAILDRYIPEIREAPLCLVDLYGEELLKTYRAFTS